MKRYISIVLSILLIAACSNKTDYPWFSGNFDDAYNDTLSDKGYVMNLIDGVRKFNWSKLCKEDMLKCNGLWRQYEG